MKKIVIVSVSCFLVFCVVIGAAISYPYYDFYANGTSSTDYRFESDFDDKIFAVLGNIEASYSDGTLSSSSQEIMINGIAVYAAIGKAKETGTLILKVNQRVAPYSPFEINYIDFTKGHKDQNGEYTSFSNLYLEGYDKNGERLLFQPAGSSGISKDGIRTTEFFICYDDNYLKAEDIENAFPISVELNGHMVRMTRESWF